MKVVRKHTSAPKPGEFIPPEPFRDLKVPQWAGVQEFAEWWLANGSPLMPPDNVVHLSDDATSIALFRYGQYQVELYLIHPGPNLPVHEHPDVEVIKMRTNSYVPMPNGTFRNKTGHTGSPPLKQGESHGVGRNFKEVEDHTGFGLLAFQKWKDGLTPTTVAARWKGPTVGPKQEQLIRKLTPGAIVRDGYADTTGVP